MKQIQFIKLKISNWQMSKNQVQTDRRIDSTKEIEIAGIGITEIPTYPLKSATR